RDSLREDLMKMLLNLAGYVQHESNNDPAIFATSGLEALPNAHVPHRPLERPLASQRSITAPSTANCWFGCPNPSAKSSSTTCGTPRLTPKAFLPVSGRRR